MAFRRKSGPGGYRLPWFDLMLGLALLLLVIRAVLQAWPPFDRKAERTVRLEVAVSGLRSGLAEQIAVGQWVKDEPSGEFMGKIIQKSAAAGEAGPDLLLVLERTGTVREREGIFFGRVAVRAGQERRFHTFYVEFTGRINRVVVRE